MLPQAGAGGPGAGQGGQGPALPTPFLAPQQPQQYQQLGSQAGLAGAAGGSGSFEAALLQTLLSAGGSGGYGSTPAGSAGCTGAMSLQEQQQALVAQAGQLALFNLQATAQGGSGSGLSQLPVLPPSALSAEQQQAMLAQLAAAQLVPSLGSGGAPPMPMPAPSQQQQGSGGGGAAAARAAAKPRSRRQYKPPDVVQAERKHKQEVAEHIRKLEQQLGRAKKELEQLQEENKALHRKALVLSKHTSFRRAATVMLEELTQSINLSSMDWSRQGASQTVLRAAERGLPAPEVLEKLRSMSVEEAVAHYTDVVAQVRQLLQQVERRPDQAAAGKQLEEIFAVGETTSTFGYLQVVNPPVYAQLMETKLEPESPVDRGDPAHWRAVLAATALSEEQEAQLILLLQSHHKQAEQIVRQKSAVMAQLAEELSYGLLSLDMTGSNEMPEGEAQAAGSGRQGSIERALSGQPSSPEPLQSKDELDRLIQLEYWLKFDLTGCVRKLLSARQQALCMVSSWPFYPDQKQLEAAIKEKAGQLWERLQRSGA